MGQCKHCGSEMREGVRFCGNCGVSQEAEMAEAEVTAEEDGEVAEKSVATVAEKNVVTDTEENTATGQKAHGEDRSPALTATVEEATEEVTATVAGENTVTGIEENTAARQEASGEAIHPAVSRPLAETSGEPVTTIAEGDSALPTPVTEAIGGPVAIVAGENTVTGTERTAAAGQETSGETAKRKPRRLRVALFAVTAVAVTTVDATVLLRRMTAMTGERFTRMQAEALRQETVPLEGLGAVFENDSSSDFMLSMQMSRSGLLVLSRSGNENYILATETLRRGIQAEVNLGRHLGTVVLDLGFSADDNTKLSFDCFLDSEKSGYRVPQVGKQVFVLNYPEVLRQYSGGARFSTAELAALVPSKVLLFMFVARYGRALATAFKPKEIKVKRWVYTSHALKHQLDYEMKGERTVYTWNPGRKTLETLSRSLVAEMREDKDFADQYNRRQEAGERLATALGAGRSKAAYLSDVISYVEKHAANWAETPEQRNLRWELAMQGEGVAAIRVVDNGKRPLFCYEWDQVGDTLYHDVGGEVFFGTFAEERNKEEDNYEGRVIERLVTLGDAWFRNFRLYYSKIPLDGRPSALGLPNGSYRYTCFDVNRPGRKYTLEIEEKWEHSVYGPDGGYDRFTLTVTRKGSTEKPTDREMDVSDELSGGGESLPQERFSDIVEKLWTEKETWSKRVNFSGEVVKFVRISKGKGSKESKGLKFSTTNAKTKRRVLITLPEVLCRASVSFGYRCLFVRNEGTRGSGLKKGEVTMGKYKHCGSETGEDGLFCANCGVRLKGEKPEAAVIKATEELPGGAAEEVAEAITETRRAEHKEVTEFVVTEATAPREPAQKEAAAEKKNAVEHKETVEHRGTAEPIAKDKISGAEAAVEGNSTGKKKKMGSAMLIAPAVLGLTIGSGTRTVSRSLRSPGKRFLARQSRTLSREAAVLDNAERVFENGLSSDFRLATEFSDRQVATLTRCGFFSGPYEHTLRDGSKARIFIGKKFEEVVLNLELGHGNDPVLQADFFIDSGYLGFRLPKKSDKVCVTQYPEALQKFDSELQLSTSMFTDLQSPKELHAATVKRYREIVAAATDRNNLKTEKRSYRSRVLKFELKHSFEKDYTIYNREPNTEKLERLSWNITDEMKEDKTFAAQYDRRQEIGEQFARASEQHSGRSAGFEDLADRLRDNTETYANRLKDRKSTRKLVTGGSEVRTALLQLDGGDTQIFCYERDTDKGKLYRGVRVPDSVPTRRRGPEKSDYYGTVAYRSSWWFYTESFTLKYSGVDFREKSMLGLSYRKYRLLPGGDEDGDGTKLEMRNESANSLHELKNKSGSFTLKTTKIGTAALPTGEEENIDDGLLDDMTPQRGVLKFIGAL